LAEVTADIRNKLQRQQTLQAVAQQGKALLGQLQSGEKVQVSWKAAQSITRAQHTDVSQPLTQLLFRADTSKLPAYVGIDDAQQGYVIARIDEVKDVTAIDSAKLNHYVQQIRQMSGEELLKAYLADSKKRADISMKDFTAEEKK
jgi:peptidyl-prolyl cis-trans isomerase D